VANWLSGFRKSATKPQVCAACEYAEKSGKPLPCDRRPWGVKASAECLTNLRMEMVMFVWTSTAGAGRFIPCAVVASCTDYPIQRQIIWGYIQQSCSGTYAYYADGRTSSSEMNRVAGSVFIGLSFKNSPIAAWIIRDHHLWVWQKGGRIHLPSNGKDRVQGA